MKKLKLEKTKKKAAEKEGKVEKKQRTKKEFKNLEDELFGKDDFI